MGANCGHAAIIRICDRVSDSVAELGEQGDLIVEGLARPGAGIASFRSGMIVRGGIRVTSDEDTGGVDTSPVRGCLAAVRESSAN
jgi:hypothetical protein